MKSSALSFRCNCQVGFKGRLCEHECEKKQAPVDVIFLVDGSGSLYSQKATNCQPEKFRYQLEFVLSVLNELDIGATLSRVGFIQFTTGIDLVQRVKLSESVTMGKEKLENHIDHVEWGSLPQYTALPPFNKCKPKLKPLGAQTNTPKGMQACLDMFESDRRPSSVPVKKMLFVMTDGKIDPISERSKAYPTAQRLLDEGIDIYAVGIKPSRISDEDLKRMQEDLVNITGRKKERVFETDDFHKLKKQVLDSVLNAVNCH